MKAHKIYKLHLSCSKVAIKSRAWVSAGAVVNPSNRQKVSPQNTYNCIVKSPPPPPHKKKNKEEVTTS